MEPANLDDLYSGEEYYGKYLDNFKDISMETKLSSVPIVALTHP